MNAYCQPDCAPGRHFHDKNSRRRYECIRDDDIGHFCHANTWFTECFENPPKGEPMFALSTVEALIRAAIADERAGIDPEPTWKPAVSGWLPMSGQRVTPEAVIYRPDAAPVEPHTLPTEAEVAQVIRDAVLNYDPSEGDEVPSMAARAILAMFDSRYTYGVWTRHDGQKVPYRKDALALDPDEALRFHAFPAECGCYPLNTDNREWACEHGATWTRGSMEPYGKPTTGPIYPYGGISGHGIVTRIDCPEPECPTCTKEDPSA